MRVKRSVDFRMATKKSSNGKGVAAEPTREEGWVASKCSESNLETLVSAGLLPEKSIIQWRPALGEDRSYENMGEIVTFVPYSERGLGLPCSFFFSRLLRYYRIQLHHLTPNSFCSHFYLRAFVRSFSGHRAPFWTLPIPFPCEAADRLLRFRCSRRCVSDLGQQDCL